MAAIAQSVFHQAIGRTILLNVWVSHKLNTDSQYLILNVIIVTECPNLLKTFVPQPSADNNYTNNESILRINMRGRLVGDQATFSCPIGYGLKGNNEIICLQSGRWSAPMPVCQGNSNVESANENWFKRFEQVTRMGERHIGIIPR